ncbi:gag-pol polyprotein [Tanacetum coccineum]
MRTHYTEISFASPPPFSSVTPPLPHHESRSLAAINDDKYNNCACKTSFHKICRNRTLVEAARTMLSASKLHLFFWAEAIATACYTQNRSIIILTYEKIDGENLDKIKEKGDPCILVGYSTKSKGYHVYNKRTRLIVKSIHLRFDEIKEMSETSIANDTSGLVPQRQKASDYDNSDPVPQLQNVSPSTDTSVPSQQELDLLFGSLYDEFFNAGTSSVNNSSSPNDNYKQQDTPPTMNNPSSTKPTTPTTNVHAKKNKEGFC